MNTLILSAAIAAALASLSGVATAATGPDARVRFKDDAQFVEESTDRLIRNESVERLRAALEHELRSVAPACLAPGQWIEVSIAEINSAGTVGSTRGATRSDVRVTRNSWVVAVRFDYRLLDEEQKVIDQGSENLHNAGFVGDDPAERITTDAYRKEKALLSGWFKARYCGPHKLKPG